MSRIVTHRSGKKQCGPVLLVAPKYHSRYGLGRFFYTVSPGLGVAYLASSLRAGGHAVDICDLQVSSPSRLWRMLRERQPRLVGISCHARTMKAALFLAREIRQMSQAAIVMGGPQAGNWARKLVDGGHADIVVRGEGEHVLPGIAERLPYARSALMSLDGVAYASDSGVVMGAVSGRDWDLDDLPFPALDLFEMAKYSPGANRALRKPALPIMTSRGCPFGCRYCDSASVFGRRLRTRTASNVRDEVRYLKGCYGKISLMVWDDTFTVDRKHALGMCEVFAAEDVEWCCTTRPDCVDRDLLSTMAESGCRYVYFGVESFSPRTLRQLARTCPSGAAEEAIRLAQESGIKTSAGVVTGLPWQNWGDILRDVRGLLRLGADYPTVNPFAAYGRRGMEVLGRQTTARRSLAERAFLGLPLDPAKERFVRTLRAAALTLYHCRRTLAGL